MEWIAENWIWIAFALGLFMLLRRRHGRGGLGGLSGCGTHGGRHHGHGERDVPGRDPSRKDTAVDPVSGGEVRIEGALTSVFGGRVYYFQSQENRLEFEASPERYAGTASGAAPQDEHARHHGPHRHHGC